MAVTLLWANPLVQVHVPRPRDVDYNEAGMWNIMG